MINALLVRWIGGWAEVVDAASVAEHGRHEGLLGLGSAQSLAEVRRIARGQLSIYARTRVEISGDLRPRDDADTPYLAFGVGDHLPVQAMSGGVSSERVMALTVSEDENGILTWAPELKDTLLEADERWEQAIKKMVDGTVRGDSKVATPASQIGLVGNVPDCCAPAAPDPGPIG